MPNLLHIFATSTAYILRATSLMCIISIVTRGRFDKNVLYLLPAIINTLVSYSAFVTGVAYSLSPTNEFVRGPLGYTPHAVSAFYLLFMLSAVQFSYKDRKSKEGFAVLGIGVVTIAAVLMEMLGGYKNLLTPSIAISATFYFLYFQTQKTLRDDATNALNKYCLDNDIAANGYQMKSLVYLDIVGLKKLNAIEGRAAGDRAIKRLASEIRAIAPSGARIYRISGADFLVIGMTQDVAEMNKFLVQIKINMVNAGIPVSAGMSVFNKGEDFEIVRSKAELELYRDKQKIKESLEKE